MTFEFCGETFEKHSYFFLMKSYPVGPCCSLRTDRHSRKLIFAFRSYTKGPNKYLQKEVRFVIQRLP